MYRYMPNVYNLYRKVYNALVVGAGFEEAAKSHTYNRDTTICVLVKAQKTKKNRYKKYD